MDFTQTAKTGVQENPFQLQQVLPEGGGGGGGGGGGTARGIFPPNR